MGSITPIGVTRMGDAIMAGELDALDEARLRADDLDAEARSAVTFQDLLEELAVLKESQQKAVVSALINGNKLSMWFIEITIATAFEKAVTAKIKEL